MLSYQIGMVIKHVNGSLNDFIDQVFVWCITHYRNEAEGVNGKRNNNEEDAAKAKQPQNLFLRKMKKCMPDKKNGKPDPGINAGPFGCDAEGHADSAKSKRNIDGSGWKGIRTAGL